MLASVVCVPMFPIAYLIFFLLNKERSYIGDAVGAGWKRVALNVVLVAALVFACFGSGISMKKNVMDKLSFPAPATIVVPVNIQSNR